MAGISKSLWICWRKWKWRRRRREMSFQSKKKIELIIDQSLSLFIGLNLYYWYLVASGPLEMFQFKQTWPTAFHLKLLTTWTPFSLFQLLGVMPIDSLINSHKNIYLNSCLSHKISFKPSCASWFLKFFWWVLKIRCIKC